VDYLARGIHPGVDGCYAPQNGYVGGNKDRCWNSSCSQPQATENTQKKKNKVLPSVTKNFAYKDFDPDPPGYFTARCRHSMQQAGVSIIPWTTLKYLLPMLATRFPLLGNE
jgi:hypothetical protein